MDVLLFGAIEIGVATKAAIGKTHTNKRKCGAPAEPARDNTRWNVDDLPTELIKANTNQAPTIAKSVTARGLPELKGSRLCVNMPTQGYWIYGQEEEETCKKLCRNVSWTHARPQVAWLLVQDRIASISEVSCTDAAS